MNNKGQSLGLSIMSALFILIIGLTFVNLLMPEITQFRTDMSCGSPLTISDGTKLMCLVTDATVPYWIVLVFSVSIGLITERMRL